MIYDKVRPSIHAYKIRELHPLQQQRGKFHCHVFSNVYGFRLYLDKYFIEVVLWRRYGHWIPCGWGYFKSWVRPGPYGSLRLVHRPWPQKRPQFKVRT